MTRHVTVFGDPNLYAGWPANHGGWQQGDEFLVGFLRGQWEAKRGAHNIVEPFQKVQARSVDGGETWAVEIPNVDFESTVVLGPPPYSWNLQTSILRVCGTYDHGGEHCNPGGGFYLSEDFGRSWHGAYAFPDLRIDPSKHWATSRTAYLVSRNLLFLSYADVGFDDYTICAHVGPTGALSPRSIVCRDEYRAVMPAVATVGSRICVALRRRAIASSWIDVFGSDDDGQSWAFLSEVSDTGGHNGNPPALIESGGRLFCAFANRSLYTINLYESKDAGKTWIPHLIRQGSTPDIGYPRLFSRSDGRLVCVYYWSEHGEPQRIEASIL